MIALLFIQPASMKQGLSQSTAVNCLELSELNISNQCYHLANYVMNTFVFCDRHLNGCFKLKIYRSIAAPDALNGSECWPNLKTNNHHLAVMEMKMLMLQLTNSVTRKIVREASSMVWTCNSRDESSLAKIDLCIEVFGKRSKYWLKQR